MAYESSKNRVLGYKAQTNFTTPISSYGAMTGYLDLMEPPQWTPKQEFEARPDAPTGKPATSRAPVPGSKDGGTLTFKMALTSMGSAWAVATDVPTTPYSSADAGTNPLFDLLEIFLGGKAVGAYNDDFGAAAGSDANTLEHGAPATLKVGAAYGWGTGTTVAGIGFVKSHTGASTTTTLLEDSPGTAANMSTYELFHGITFYPTSNPTPSILTFLAVSTTTLADRYYSAYPQSFRIMADPGKTPTIEFTFVCGGKDRVTHGLTLTALTPAQNLAIPPALDVNYGKFNIGGAQTGGNGTYAAADDADCVTAFSIEVTVSADPVKCHGHATGTFQDVSNRLTTDVNVTASMTIAHSDSYDGTTETVWQEYFDAQTTQSLTLTLGKTSGRCFAIAIPAAHQSTPPTPTIIGSALVATQTAWEANTWTSDGASTDAGNSSLRIAFL